MLQDPRLTAVLASLALGAIACARMARVQPTTAWQWRGVWVTFVFLFWLLAGFFSVRSR